MTTRRHDEFFKPCIPCHCVVPNTTLPKRKCIRAASEDFVESSLFRQKTISQTCFDRRLTRSRHSSRQTARFCEHLENRPIPLRIPCGLCARTPTRSPIRGRECLTDLRFLSDPYTICVHISCGDD